MPENQRKHRIQSHYLPRLNATEAHYDILDWASEDAQHARFLVLDEVLAQRGLYNHATPLRILDIGCGLTDLATFLQDRERAFEYTGVELVPEIAVAAREKFPDRKIVVADIVEHPPFPRNAFDCVFCSGVFNLETGDNDTYIEMALKHILATTAHCAVVNFLHERSRRKYSHCHYYCPAEILGVLHRIHADGEIVDNYLENDFTVVIDKQPRP